VRYNIEPVVMHVKHYLLYKQKKIVGYGKKDRNRDNPQPSISDIYMSDLKVQRLSGDGLHTKASL